MTRALPSAPLLQEIWTVPTVVLPLQSRPPPTMMGYVVGPPGPDSLLDHPQFAEPHGKPVLKHVALLKLGVLSWPRAYEDPFVQQNAFTVVVAWPVRTHPTSPDVTVTVRLNVAGNAPPPVPVLHVTSTVVRPMGRAAEKSQQHRALQKRVSVPNLHV